MAVKVTKRGKVRHMRGQRWHGWGAKKKHRGKGSKGGRGKAGRHKHKFSYVNTVDPYNYGYKGFVPPTKVGIVKNIINVGELQKLAETKKVSEIDLNEFGFTKLLGRGEITKVLAVKIDDYSKSAKEKIEKAGGKIISENLAEAKHMSSARSRRTSKEVIQETTFEDAEEKE